MENKEDKKPDINTNSSINTNGGSVIDSIKFIIAIAVIGYVIVKFLF